jgi:hypothetical protein
MSVPFGCTTEKEELSLLGERKRLGPNLQNMTLEPGMEDQAVLTVCVITCVLMFSDLGLAESAGSALPGWPIPGDSKGLTCQCFLLFCLFLKWYFAMFKLSIFLLWSGLISMYFISAL